jgi:hypothetical protein
MLVVVFELIGGALDGKSVQANYPVKEEELNIALSDPFDPKQFLHYQFDPSRKVFVFVKTMPADDLRKVE